MNQIPVKEIDCDPSTLQGSQRGLSENGLRGIPKSSGKNHGPDINTLWLSQLSTFSDTPKYHIVGI